ncbi:MAG: radical SAM protein [Planctomycetota bacterium]|nr:radical SAM protein [Planctomycetota bacterium]
MQSITRKSLLYKTDVEYGDFCLNHIEGCSHGCRFPCYAYMMKRSFGKVKDYQDWCRPKIVSNALELLDKEIPKYKNKINYVHLCFSTDPFMYKQEAVQDLSLQIIDKLNENEIPCSVLTKGILPKELANKNGLSKNNEYGITIISIDEGFRKQFEPNTAPYKERVNSLKRLHNSGFKTRVSMEPYPTPNIIQQDLQEILNAISFVGSIYFGRWNYNRRVSDFKYDKEFYNSMASAVIKFCKKNRIDYHIKEGTQNKYA